MNNCKKCRLRAGSFYSIIIEDNPEVLLKSFEQSVDLKISTDSPNAGGVMMESNYEKNINELLQLKFPNLIVASNKGLTRLNKRNKIVFPSNCENLKEFIEECKKCNNPLSSADLFLLQICETEEGETWFCLRDGVSFKSSTSSSTSFAYFHNDPEGEIYDACLKNKKINTGQILFILYDEEEVIFCYFDDCFTKITSLFKKNKVNKTNGDMVYHGNDCTLNLSRKQGSNRQLVHLINRQKKKKKKDSDEDLKSTSFTRGVKIDKEFAKVLIKKGIFKLISRQKLNISLFEEKDFEMRYPQLSQPEGGKNDNSETKCGE